MNLPHRKIQPSKQPTINGLTQDQITDRIRAYSEMFRSIQQGEGIHSFTLIGCNELSKKLAIAAEKFIEKYCND